MLEPDQRRLLTDALRPPDGYTLDEAIGCTYSLDLIALARVFRVARDTDYLDVVWFFRGESKPLSNRVFIPKVGFRKRLVDDGNAWGAGVVLFSQTTPEE